MSKFTHKFITWTLVLVFMAILAGCQEEEQQEQTANPKQAKLVAAENIQLKKDLAARDAEIEKQKALLVTCEEEKEKLNKSLNQNSENLVETLMESMDKDTQNINIENQELKKQVEELKKQLETKQ